MSQCTGPETPTRAFRATAGPWLPPGFGLLEVTVALAVLTLATLGIVQVLAAGVAHTGRSLRLRRALQIAELTAARLQPGDPVGSHWEPVDVDGAPGAGRLPCRRRIDDVAVSGRTWFVVWVECGQAKDAVLTRLQVMR